MRRVVASALIVACLSAIPGCEWRGLNSLSLPGTEGSGDGSYTIQAQLPDVVVIQQNTRVRVADVNVGNVTKIEVQDWHALVTMRINGDVHLPANTTAKVGQTSLLGSMHIELAPPTDEPPQGELKRRFGDSAVVGPARIRPPSRHWRRCRSCSTAAGLASCRRSTRRSPRRWRAARTTCAAC